MEATILAGLLTAVAGGAIWSWRRRLTARRRTADLLSASLGRLGWSSQTAGGRRLEILERRERIAAVDLGRLERVLSRADGAGRRRVLHSIAGAAGLRPAPLPGTYDLKHHGVLTVPRLASEGLLLVTAGAPPVSTEPFADGSLRLVYQVLDRSELIYVTDDHLAAAGIDPRDLHGLALAVLRQRFDPTATIAAARTGELAQITDDNGCGGSGVLLLTEALGPGEELFAAAPEPGMALVATDRQRLESALAGRELPTEPLAPAVLRITAAGIIQ